MCIRDSCEGKVAPVREAPDVELGIVKAARASFPPGKSEALRDGGIQRLPPGKGCPNVVEAPAQLGAHARLCDL
eukprot:9916242-Alexandrium_andersonii.AAC.1